MKLGICYMVFDGEELLEFALKSIRSQIDYISVTYQTTSYFGNPCDPNLIPLLENLKNKNLIDELIFFEPNLSIHHKENELKLRNIGLEASKKAGCTHHISSDVDEFYLPNELEYAKTAMEEDDYDLSIVSANIYYKDPTFLVVPHPNMLSSFIHPIDNEYENIKDFPFAIETTRRLKKYNKCKIFKREEFIIHHMSYVRKNLYKKLANSDNGRFYKTDKFIDDFNTYKVGDRVCLLPSFLNRKTITVPNIFNIHF